MCSTQTVRNGEQLGRLDPQTTKAPPDRVVQLAALVTRPSLTTAAADRWRGDSGSCGVPIGSQHQSPAREEPQRRLSFTVGLAMAAVTCAVRDTQTRRVGRESRWLMASTTRTMAAPATTSATQ
jgi:hypothetical protein